MKLNKTVRDQFRIYKEDTDVLHKAEIVKIIKTYSCPIDTDKLLEQEYGRAANRLIAESRDSEGVRTVLATDTSEETFIDIEKCIDAEKLKSVMTQLQKRMDGIRKTYYKAAHRHGVVAGQVHMDEVMTSQNSSVQLWPQYSPTIYPGNSEYIP